LRAESAQCDDKTFELPLPPLPVAELMIDLMRDDRQVKARISSSGSIRMGRRTSSRSSHLRKTPGSGAVRPTSRGFSFHPLCCIRMWVLDESMSSGQQFLLRMSID
jgi:hypothetical protein